LPDLDSILNCEPERVIAKGVAFKLRRPTVADLAEALHVNATTPTDANAWMIKRHLLTENGVPSSRRSTTRGTARSRSRPYSSRSSRGSMPKGGTSSAGAGTAAPVHSDRHAVELARGVAQCRVEDSRLGGDPEAAR
jgi:hypothetical protein